ncbi:MAG: class I SAM-dependent methyltransferase [Anaeromyxobacteraceae bacterium]
MRPVYVTWRDAAGEHRSRWISPSSPSPPRAIPVDDRVNAGQALARARRGEGLAYTGDFQNARQLLAAMGRRLATRQAPGGDPRARFLAERRQRALEHDVLSRLLVPIGGGYEIPLRRAPACGEALTEALGPPPGEEALLPLRDLLGMVGAHEWRRRGVAVAALGGARLHPHYGVFAPVRAEHVDLVAAVAADRGLAGRTALDAGTGTGVLAFVLARAGARVVATDLEPRAVACAREGAAALGLAGAVEVLLADLFPPGDARYDLVVSNPPWLPGEAVSPLERAIYDPGGAFLARLLAELPARLAPGGEAWIVLSDLAELLGLRPAGEVERLAAAAGLRAEVLHEVRPSHPRTKDRQDPLFDVRSRERTLLWRVRAPSVT